MADMLLIDLSSICHPLYHVSANDPDPNATSVKAVARVRALASGQSHVAVCVEGGRSFRKDLDATYKANRPEHDAVLQHQIGLAIETLKADGFPVWRADGYEADDIIASACGAAEATGAFSEETHHVTIATDDKDMLQLVCDAISVHKLRDGSVLGPKEVEEKTGVRPDQFLDFLTLVGDASDNVKGCKGVGATRAAGLLREHGTLETIIEAAHKDGAFTPALERDLREFEGRCYKVRDLLRLRFDAPIPFGEIFEPRVSADVSEMGAIAEQLGAAERDYDGVDYVRPGDAALADDASALNDSGEKIVTLGVSKEAVDILQASVADNDARRGLVVREPDVLDAVPVEWERQLEPRTMAQSIQFATLMFQSRLFSAYGTSQGVLATIVAGRELGLPCMASLRGFHIIEGKPYLAADLIRALVLRHDAIEYFRCVERTDERATFTAKRKGDPEISLTFTIEDGRRAWSKKPEAWEASGWGKNPADMCVARASSKLARLVAPEIAFSLYAPEEA